MNIGSGGGGGMGVGGGGMGMGMAAGGAAALGGAGGPAGAGGPGGPAGAGAERRCPPGWKDLGDGVFESPKSQQARAEQTRKNEQTVRNMAIDMMKKAQAQLQAFLAKIETFPDFQKAIREMWKPTR